MKMLMAASALALAMTVAGALPASAYDWCHVDCSTYEPCDGYCVDTWQLLPCGDLWLIVQECQPYDREASFGLKSAIAPAAQGTASAAERPDRPAPVQAWSLGTEAVCRAR